MRRIRIGTRGSALALAQTGQIAEAIRAANPGLEPQIITIRTTGDLRRDAPFAAVGVKGMFVKEIEEALLAREIDLGIHSMKDMPGEMPEGLALAAVPAREDPRDALVSSGPLLSELPPAARVGTSSLRRRAQLKLARPDLQVDELRGNLDTRLRKLDEGRYDAILLACAGLQRLGLAARIRERLPVEQFTPAPGQGALALQIRADNDDIRALLAPLSHPETADAVRAERAFQAELGAGCTVPAGAHAIAAGGRLRILAMIASAAGEDSVRLERTGDRDSAEALGREAAQELLERGGRLLLEAS